MSNTAYDITIKDYEEWLKNNKKVKVAKEGETLGTYDEQENRALYNQYVNEANLLNQRMAKENQLAKQKAAALRDNYVASEKVEKKAEDMARMQGIATGASQSDLIDLYARGAAARAGIIQANDNAKNDVFSAYGQALAESKASTNKAIADISTKRTEYEEDVMASHIKDYLSGVIDKEVLDSYYANSEKYLSEGLKNAYYNVDNEKADSEFANALDLYSKQGIGIDALTKAYEDAGEYADDDMVAVYNKYLSDDAKAKEDAKDEQADKELQAAIDNYKNGVTGYDELTAAYERAGDYVNADVKDYLEAIFYDEQLYMANNIYDFVVEQLKKSPSKLVVNKLIKTVSKKINQGDINALNAVVEMNLRGALPKKEAEKLIKGFKLGAGPSKISNDTVEEIKESQLSLLQD